MADLEVLQGKQEECDPVENLDGVRVEMDGLNGRDGEISESPNLRQSARKKSLRSFISRGRLSKSKPKSPLLRMAEMRRGGLKGKALRHPGLKSLKGPDQKILKGLKNREDRGCKVLETIPEDFVSDVVLESGEGLDVVEVVNNIGGNLEEGEIGLNHADEMFVEMLQGNPLEEDSLVNPEINNEGSEQTETVMLDTNEAALSLAETDFALDLCEAQPLQSMVFLSSEKTPERGECLLKWGNGNEGSKWANLQDCRPNEMLSKEEFPPLSKDLLWAGKNKGASSSSAGQRGKDEQRSEEARKGESIPQVQRGHGFGSQNNNVNGV